jgi:hypothetical protein
VGWLRVRWRLVRDAWLVTALLAACGGRTQEPQGSELCPDLCEKAKKCMGAPPVASCDDLCLGEDFRATGTGCHAQYDASERCLADLSDICTGQKACAAQIQAASTCEIAYCMRHPQDEACVVPTQ